MRLTPVGAEEMVGLKVLSATGLIVVGLITGLPVGTPVSTATPLLNLTVSTVTL
jgi:hypothetical protein